MPRVRGAPKKPIIYWSATDATEETPNDPSGRHWRDQFAASSLQFDGNRLRCVVERIYPSKDHAGLAEIVADFVKTAVQSACFRVPGPVRKGRCKISNLPWTIDAAESAAQLRLKSVGLINDMEALDFGLDALESKNFVTISEGASDAEGNIAVVSAGSGLGEAVCSIGMVSATPVRLRKRP